AGDRDRGGGGNGSAAGVDGARPDLRSAARRGDAAEGEGGHGRAVAGRRRHRGAPATAHLRETDPRQVCEVRGGASSAPDRTAERWRRGYYWAGATAEIEAT